MNLARILAKTIGLSAITATLVLAVLYGNGKSRWLIPAHAQDEENAAATTGCKLATFTGHYGVLASASNPDVAHFTDVGLLESNGDGKVVEYSTVNYNGKINHDILSGTYTLASNCTGTMTVTSELNKLTYDYAFVMVTNGSEIDLMSTTVTIVQTKVGKRVS